MNGPFFKDNGERIFELKTENNLIQTYFKRR